METGTEINWWLELAKEDFKSATITALNECKGIYTCKELRNMKSQWGTRNYNKEPNDTMVEINFIV